MVLQQITTASLLKPQRTSNNDQLDFINVIGELNEKLNIKWNAVLTVDGHPHMERVIKSLQVPLIIITKDDDNSQLHLLHSHKVLSIVLAEVATLNRVYDCVQHHLKYLQSSQIFWILPEAGEKDLLYMANRSWFEGYTKNLYYTQQGLFIYNSVPVGSIRRIWKLQDYIDNTKQILDFKQYPLTVPIVQDHPRCCYLKNREGKLIRSGYLLKTMDIFVKQFNFTLKELSISNLAYDDVLLIKMLAEGTIDFIPTINFLENVSTTIAVDILEERLLVPYPNQLSEIQLLLLPYDSAAKLAILLLLIFCTFAFSFIFWFGRFKKIDFSKSALHILAAFISQNHLNFKYTTFRRKLVHVLLFLNGFIVTNLYLAKLSSFMVKSIYEAKIKTFEDLNKTGLKVLMYDQFYYSHFDPTIPASVYDIAKPVDGATLLDSIFNFTGSYIVPAFTDQIKFTLFQQPYIKTIKFYVPEQIFSKCPVNFTVRQGLPYIELFNRFFRYIVESGIYEKLWSETFVEGICGGEIHDFKRYESLEDLSPNFSSFKAHFMLLGCGVILSLIAFISEFIYFYYGSRR